MITRVSHSIEGTDPAGLDLALSVARELHRPVPRAPEVTVPQPQMMGLHLSADHPHRRKVPLSRLSRLSQLSTLGV
ncbi:hypothetical protein ACGFY3_27825 [Streptomyces mirabilis]|jgi:hypothetical protein|uniref:hypothetical protein n=1 Tax=Streptomyces TaxID=1883 RepID=UPI000BB11995|nr:MULTISPECIES: hypothetical protein [Streptomyces]MCT9106178.1 hypothetical protein [Streptomyces mirabilis]MCX4434889.1 hypothetical protein [Streptomyces mirabilis]PBC97987.1 hypothetical protein BX281_6045 [Streptomyces sp. Ag82_O1-15]SOE72830.1 hypothetical protein SAMN05446589_4598 [Streptomyces sp. OV198]